MDSEPWEARQFRSQVMFTFWEQATDHGEEPQPTLRAGDSPAVEARRGIACPEGLRPAQKASEGRDLDEERSGLSWSEAISGLGHTPPGQFCSDPSAERRWPAPDNPAPRPRRAVSGPSQRPPGPPAIVPLRDGPCPGPASSPQPAAGVPRLAGPRPGP